MPTPLLALAEIADRYDGYILDVWGTLYDGGTAFDGAVAAVQKLSETGKRAVVLSNSPRAPEVVAERLTGIGFDLAWFSNIVTSGGMVADVVGSRKDPVSAELGDKVFWLGRDRFPDTLPPESYSVVEEVSVADWVLNAGPDATDSKVADYESVLLASAARGLPMVCANPDKSVFHRGERHICAGAIAARYEEIGGAVKYFGKPYPEILKRCVDLLDCSAENVLVVGDNLETDILGANRTGIDSLLLRGGIHSGEFASTDRAADALADLVGIHGSEPTYVADRLVW